MLLNIYIFINFVALGINVICTDEAKEDGVSISDILVNCTILETFTYKYIDFFPIGKHNTIEILLKFHVKTRSNAHILLSSTAAPTDQEPVYEIVLGGGDNTFSEIRRSQKAQSKSTVITNGIVSADEWRSFWIHISNGLIRVGKEGEDTPTMFWQDPEPLDVEYFSFSTWIGIFGEWAYDCSSNADVHSEDVDLPTEAIPEIPIQLTPLEKLKQDLFLSYDPYATPIYAIQFKTQIRIMCWHIDLDAHTGILHIYGMAKLSWNDDRLVWEPEKYDGQNMLMMANFLTWRPEIVLMNGVFANEKPFGPGNTIIISDGSVFWTPSLKMQTRCNINLKNWPWDSQKCQIQFVIYTPEASITADNQTGIPTVVYPEKTSTWIVTGTRVSTSYTMSDQKSNSSKESLTIEITLQRNVSLFQYTLCFTFIAISFMTLSSFWISPESPIKTLTNILSLVLASLFLLLLVNSMPEYTTEAPNLYVGYLFLYVIIGLSNCFSIYLIYMVRSLHNLPCKLLFSCINNRFVQLVLFLPLDKQSINYDELREKYEEINADAENSQRRKSIRISRINAIQNDWLRIATAIDHFLLIIYSLFIAFLIANFIT